MDLRKGGILGKNALLYLAFPVPFPVGVSLSVLTLPRAS